jgi:hypothetical protein
MASFAVRLDLLLAAKVWMLGALTQPQAYDEQQHSNKMAHHFHSLSVEDSVWALYFRPLPGHCWNGGPLQVLVQRPMPGL